MYFQRQESCSTGGAGQTNALEYSNWWKVIETTNHTRRAYVFRDRWYCEKYEPEKPM